MQRKNETKNITTTPIQAYLLVLVHFLVRRRPELERRAGVGLSSEWSGVKWEWSARELLEKRGCKGKKKKKKRSRLAPPSSSRASPARPPLRPPTTALSPGTLSIHADLAASGVRWSGDEEEGIEHKQRREKRKRETRESKPPSRTKARIENHLFLGQLQSLDVLVARGTFAEGDPVDKGGRRRGGLGRRAEGQGGQGHQGERRRAAHDFLLLFSRGREREKEGAKSDELSLLLARSLSLSLSFLAERRKGGSADSTLAPFPRPRSLWADPRRITYLEIPPP